MRSCWLSYKKTPFLSRHPHVSQTNLVTKHGSSTFENPKSDTSTLICSLNSSRLGSSIIDYGAGDHICSSLKYFKNYPIKPINIRLPNDNFTVEKVKGIVHLLIQKRQCAFFIKNAHSKRCDNQSTIHIAAKPIIHEWTKHLEIDCYFLREKVQEGLLKLPTCLQVDNWLISLQNKHLSWSNL